MDGFKIVNLYSEVQTKPKEVSVEYERSMVYLWDVDVEDEMSMVDPEEWNNWTDDPNCVAIVAGWGDPWQKSKGWKKVRDRRIKVAEWLNRNHGRKVGKAGRKEGKVGTLGTSPAGYPYHPQHYHRNKGKILPEFKFKDIPEQ